MVDHVNRKKRSAIMASVRTKNTGPELRIRRHLYKLGYRYRLHRRDLPGSPDIVFPSQKKAIFVHGCFWHGHGCRWGQPPRSNLEYWIPKIEANQLRDSTKNTALYTAGWTSLVLWQCELRDIEDVLRKILEFVGPPGATKLK